MRLYAVRLLAIFSLALVGVGRAEISPLETVTARKMYFAKCAKCHELYNPKVYSDAEWDSWIKKMGKKSKLKPAQLQLLVRYTDALRNPVVPPANK